MEDTVTITLCGGMYSGDIREMPNDPSLHYCNVTDEQGGVHWYKRFGDDWLYIDSTVSIANSFISVTPVDEQQRSASA